MPNSTSGHGCTKHPAEAESVELRWISRRIADLTVEWAREKNRLHAVHASRTMSTIVVNDIQVNIRHLARRIQEIVRQG
ncbi:hypothetical protein [Longibacter sp.]|uniref:hypothetical protein n=1 Tax=Longibacter sp. TaxID=2045415 RepID=UPI003EB9267F